MNEDYNSSALNDMGVEVTFYRLNFSGDGDEKRPFRVMLSLWDFGQCDAKRCTGRKLIRMNMVREMKKCHKFKGIVLSPDGKIFVSPADRELALNGGIGVIDCSWAKINEIPLTRLKGHGRLSNPINYGRPHKLSCAEALSAALYIMGLHDEAIRVMGKFKWGHAFLNLNMHLLMLYSKCEDESEVLGVQNEYMIICENERLKKNKKISDSSLICDEERRLMRMMPPLEDSNGDEVSNPNS